MEPYVLALIGSAGSFVMAAAAWRNTRGNGQGSLVNMGEKTLIQLGRIEERLEQHLADPDAHRN